MDYKFEIKTAKKKDALVIRLNSSTAQLKENLLKSHRELIAYLASNNEFPSGFPFVIYHSMDMDNLDIEVGYPINRKFLGTNTITMGHTPGGNVLSCNHVGSYDKLFEAYNELEKKAELNSLVLSGLAYEIYLNNPADTPVNDLITEVGFILED